MYVAEFRVARSELAEKVPSRLHALVMGVTGGSESYAYPCHGSG